MACVLYFILCPLSFANRSRKDEIRSLTANDFTEFYGRVKGIKDFHRKHPNEVLSVFAAEQSVV